MPDNSKAVQRKRTQDPKQFGDIDGKPVGTTWDTRVECSRDAVHAPTRAGIHGSAEDGAYSVVISGGYEDDEDCGETFIYTGSGGRDTDGTRLDQLQGKSPWDGPQSKNQEWTHENKSLKRSADTKLPVRVIRGHGLQSDYAPGKGYRYDGLYTVERAWQEEGKKGFLMCRCEFKRLPGQPPLQRRNAVVDTTRVNKRLRASESRRELQMRHIHEDVETSNVKPESSDIYPRRRRLPDANDGPFEKRFPPTPDPSHDVVNAAQKRQRITQFASDPVSQTSVIKNEGQSPNTVSEVATAGYRPPLKNLGKIPKSGQSK